MFRLHPSVAAILLSCALSTLPASVSAQEPQTPRIDVTGTWLFTVTTDAGTGSPTVTLTQKGDSLTGHYSSQLLGEADFRGTVTDGKITFSFTVEVQGTSLAVTYSGTVDSRDSMKGSVTLGALGSGTFTAKRQ